MMLTEFIQNTFVEAYADSDGEHQEIEEPLGMRGQRIQESGRGRDCSAENPEDQCAERQNDIGSFLRCLEGFSPGAFGFLTFFSVSAIKWLVRK